MASIPPIMPPMGPVAGALPALPAMPMAPLPPAAGLDIADYAAGAPYDPQQHREESAIEKLRPDSDLHTQVMGKLEAMFKFSANAMSSNTHRWNWMEHKIQAYLSLPDYKTAMDTLKNNTGQPPEPVKVIVPYSYATIHAAATFLASVLLGRRPIFPLMAVSGTTADKARYMEQAVQANIEMSKGYEVLWQFIWDSLVYGFGVARIGWTERYGKSLRLVGGRREIVEGLKYAGNVLTAVDPYNYFPDPRVPMHHVSEKGDFNFWQTSQSKMILKDMQKDGLLKWVDEACDKYKSNNNAGELPAVADSQRRARIGANNGLWTPTAHDVIGFIPVREGTVRLVPKDWKLGDGDRSELWKFMWTHRGQIMQAEPLGMMHERHNVSVIEPTSFGHEFGSLSMADMISPFQDIISWLVNSRIENVRTTINNQFIVDPGRIEMQDLRAPAVGRAIRLKQTAFGTPVQDAIRQLQVMDVTMGHFNDLNVMRTLADTVTGINDNMRGVQTQGGRRSATEARMSMQAGASRLSQMAVRISSQGFNEIAEQMINNIQQFMPNEMWVQVTGDDGQMQSSLLTPDMIVGSFNYQISDGSLPYDKMALVEVWQQILFGIAKDPELRQRYDLGRIFEHVAILGGAKNISSFAKQQPAIPGPEMMGDPAAAGAVPIGSALPAPPDALAAAGAFA